MRDPYRVLGVSPDATEDDIRRAYRAAARREHPDVSGRADAAERMADLNAAYAEVGDPEARAETSPPAGWPPMAGPPPPRRRHRTARRIARVLLGLLLLAALVATLGLAILYVRAEPQPAELAVAATAAPPSPPTSVEVLDTARAQTFATDAEGCMYWRQYELQAARSVDILREAATVARAGPTSEAVRRAALRDLAPQLTPMTRQLRDARAVVVGQEIDSGLKLPWRPVSESLHRGAIGLREYYRRFLPDGTMPRRAPAAVVAALDAVDAYDGLVRELGPGCS